MNNRNNQSNQDTVNNPSAIQYHISNKSFINPLYQQRYNHLKRSVIEGLGTAAAVSLALYPLDCLTIWVRYSKEELQAKNFFDYMIKNPDLKLRICLNNIKTSTFKFTALPQGKYLAAHFENIIGGKDYVHAKENGFQPNSKLRTTAATSAASGLMATTEIMTTGYWANEAMLARLNIDLKINTMKQKIQLTKAAFGPHLFKKGSTAFFYVGAQSLIKPELEKLLPSKESSSLKESIAFLIAGACSGFAYHIGESVHQRSMLAIDPKSLKTPAMTTVIKNMYGKFGLEGFTKGWKVSTIYGVPAFGALWTAKKFFEYAFGENHPNNKLGNSEKIQEHAKRPDSQLSFFKSKPSNEGGITNKKYQPKADVTPVEPKNRP